MRSLALAGLGLVAFSCVQAEAGQCYRRVVDPPQYSTVAEQVLVSPEREVADYVPAVTREVQETVVVRPQQTLVHEIPAEFGYEDQDVVATPAHREWQVRNENGQVIGCWVNVPPLYARVRRRVEISPAREVQETIPAETATRVRTEIVEPEHAVARVIPARYETRERRVLVSTGGARWAPLDFCPH